MSLSCKAVIFDLYGVLVYSESVIRQQWKQWAARQGVPFERVEAVYSGRPAVQVIEAVAPHLNAAAEAETVGEEGALDGLEAFDGAEEMLRALPEDRWAIATSGRHETASTRLSHAGLPRPTVFVTADDVERGKPAPDPYRQAARRLDVAPDQCVVVEDTPAGLEAAQTAGARVLAVTTTHEAAPLAGATAVVPAINALRIREGDDALHVEWSSERGNEP